jgi:hypothetical protein
MLSIKKNTVTIRKGFNLFLQFIGMLFISKPVQGPKRNNQPFFPPGSGSVSLIEVQHVVIRRLPGGLEEFLLLLGPRPPVPTRPRPLVQDTEEEEDTMNTDTMARSESTFSYHAHRYSAQRRGIRIRGWTLPEIAYKVVTYNKSPSIDGCVDVQGVAASDSCSSISNYSSTCRQLGPPPPSLANLLSLIRIL